MADRQRKELTELKRPDNVVFTWLSDNSASVDAQWVDRRFSHFSSCRAIAARNPNLV